MNKLASYRIIGIAILSFIGSGCVAVWGEAHKITSSDSNGIRIQFDKAYASSARTAAIAREHCKKFNKVAEPVGSEMPGLLFGIIEDSYNCSPKE